MAKNPWESNESNPWHLTLAERLLGTPLNAPGLDQVEEERRLAMGALLFNDELDPVEKRAMRAFKSPLDMARWLTAGTERWGVDPKFAPMRTFERALALRGFLGGDAEGQSHAWGYRADEVPVVGEIIPLAPQETAAAQAWRHGPKTRRNADQAASAMPKSAFALTLRRRALPLEAAGGHVLRNLLPYGAVGLAMAASSAGMGALGMLAGVVAAVAKAIDLARVDHGDRRPRFELLAAREALASNRRLWALREKALEAAQGMGLKLSQGASTRAEQEQAKSLRKQADELESQARAALRGTVLESLANASKAQEMRSKSKKLIEQAQNIESRLGDKKSDHSQAQSRAASRDLSNFARWAHNDARASMQLENLRQKSLAAFEREQVSKASSPSQDQEAAPRSLRRL